MFWKPKCYKDLFWRVWGVMREKDPGVKFSEEEVQERWEEYLQERPDLDPETGNVVNKAAYLGPC